uniref:Uncharacterized protein n=1 Tax=Glycine max TaxID=3847 RepID=K7MCX3_SOYBN
MKKKETKRRKQVGEDGRDESRFQDGRRLQKKTRGAPTEENRNLLHAVTQFGFSSSSLFRKQNPTFFFMNPNSLFPFQISITFLIQSLSPRQSLHLPRKSRSMWSL